MFFNKNIRYVRTNFMNIAQTINEKLKFGPILQKIQIATEGFGINTRSIRKQRVIPLNSSNICSRPDDFTIGVFQKYMKTPLTNTATNNPITDNNISRIDHPSEGFRYSSSISTQPLLPLKGLLPHMY